MSLGLSDGLVSSDIGQRRGLVPVLLEDDQDMEEGIRKQTGIYGNGSLWICHANWSNVIMSWKPSIILILSSYHTEVKHSQNIQYQLK